jgi:hypothetical protein
MNTLRLTTLTTKLFASLFALPIAFLLTATCHAQFGAAATFSVSHIEYDPNVTYAGHEAWVYGPTLSAQYQTDGTVGFGFDIRFAFLRNGVYGVNAGDFGPRIVLDLPRLHCKPYVEYLLGAMEARGSTSTKFTGHIDAQFIVGADIPVRRHLDLRLEYASGGISGIPAGGEDGRQQFSTGFLAHF